MIRSMLYKNASAQDRGTSVSDMLGSLLLMLETSRGSLDLQIVRYLLPLTFVPLVVMFLVWRLQRREWKRA